MAYATFIWQLSVLLVAAFLGGLAAKRFGYPTALGELSVGMVIGPFGLALVGQSEIVLVFAELGAIILLFYIGLKTELSLLKKYLVPAVLSGVLGAIVPFGLVYGGGLLLGFGIEESLFLAAVFTATSLGITARMLAELRQSHTPLGMTILGAGVVDDIAAVVIVTLVADLLSGGVRLSDFLGLMGRIASFWVVVLVLGSRFFPRVLDRFRADTESLTIIVVALSLAAAFAAVTMGMSTVIGAFAIGVALSSNPRVVEVLDRGTILYLFFVPIFFISIGMMIDFRQLLPNLLPVLFITALAIGGKVLGCGLATRLTGFGWMDALRIGVGMSPRGEMGLVVAEIGAVSGLLSSAIFSVSVAAVALTTVIGMPLLKLLLQKASN